MKKENTWCDALSDFRSEIKYSPISGVNRPRRAVIKKARRTNRLRRQPEHLQRESQRQRFVAEQQLGETGQQVES
jgi:hypothetical protein